MKSAILYGSRVKLTNAHKPVFSKTKPPNAEAQPEYFVRMKIISGENMLDALSRAKPMVGETVLNTVPID